MRGLLICSVVFVCLLLSVACDDTGYPFVVVEESVEVFYSTQNPGTVDVMVRNSLMATVRTLVDSQEFEAGDHSVIWDLFDDGGEYPGDGLYTVEVWLDGERVSVTILEVNRQ